jgi:hypothetical protein
VPDVQRHEKSEGCVRTDCLLCVPAFPFPRKERLPRYGDRRDRTLRTGQGRVEKTSSQALSPVRSNPVVPPRPGGGPGEPRYACEKRQEPWSFCRFVLDGFSPQHHCGRRCISLRSNPSCGPPAPDFPLFKIKNPDGISRGRNASTLPRWRLAGAARRGVRAYRTRRTGHFASRITRSATLPIRLFRMPVLPWEAMTMRSAFRSCCSWRIAS